MRIIMDETRRGRGSDYNLSKRFIKGETYDSRSEGIYYVSDTQARTFIRLGWAHEQTMEEWIARLKASPEGQKPINQAISQMIDILMPLPNKAMEGFRVKRDMLGIDATFETLESNFQGEKK